MKKAAKNRRDQHARARAERRKRARATAKAARPRIQAHFFDDCPICQAMRDVGAVHDADGVVVMTSAKQRAYERRLEEIIARDGWPEGAQLYDSADIERVRDEVEVLRDRERAERVAAGGLN